MIFTCSQCSQPIEIDDAELVGLSEGIMINCPACDAQVPMPATSAAPVQIPPASAAPPAVASPASGSASASNQAAALMFQKLNRRMIILGAAALLALGGLAGYLAFQLRGDRVELNQDITNQILKNKFFTDLIASGGTTMDQLRKVARIEMKGQGFIGLSREEYTWEQAQEFARSTGSKVLAVESPSENKAPWVDPTMQRLVNFLEHRFPAAQGTTVWVMQNSAEKQPRVFHAPDVSLVSTSERTRKVFLDWRPPPPKPAQNIPLPPPRVVPKSDKLRDIEITAIKAPVEFTPTKEVRLRAKVGEKFKMELTVWYKTPVPTKLASNLLLKEANILPPEFIAELSAKHSATWHFDTESRPGYHSVNGEDEIIFDLTGYAPKTKGEHKFRMNVGLFDKQTWATEVMKYYPVTLTVE